MSFAWSVVLSALLGAGCGVAFAYSNYKFFKNKIHSSLFRGGVIATIPFAIYFSMEQTPLLTQLFYFLPVFGAVYMHVSSLVIEQKEDEAREIQHEEYQAKQNMKEEEERLEREKIEELDSKNLDRRIRKLRGD